MSVLTQEMSKHFLQSKNEGDKYKVRKIIEHFDQTLEYWIQIFTGDFWRKKKSVLNFSDLLWVNSGKQLSTTQETHFPSLHFRWEKGKGGVKAGKFVGWDRNCLKNEGKAGSREKEDKTKQEMWRQSLTSSPG